jgi:hypothetical protein
LPNLKKGNKKEKGKKSGDVAQYCFGQKIKKPRKGLKIY